MHQLGCQGAKRGVPVPEVSQVRCIHQLLQEMVAYPEVGLPAQGPVQAPAQLQQPLNNWGAAKIAD